MSQLKRKVAEQLATIKSDGSGYRDLDPGDLDRICDRARRIRALHLPNNSVENQIASAAIAAVNMFDRGEI